MATPIMGFVTPTTATQIRYLYKSIADLGVAVELTVNMQFATMADLSSKLSGVTLVGGMEAWIADTKTKLIYDGTAWQQIYPPKPNILSGTAAPTASQGNVGDIYMQV